MKRLVHCLWATSSGALLELFFSLVSGTQIRMTMNMSALLKAVQNERRLLTYFVLTRKNRPAVDGAIAETDRVLRELMARSDIWDIEFSGDTNQTIAGELR